MQNRPYLSKPHRYAFSAFFIAGALLFFTFFSCSKKGSEAENFYRLIDQLSEKSIIETPLSDFKRKFENHEQNLGKEFANFTDIMGVRDYHVAAFSTDYPILAADDRIQPEHVKVREKGRQLPFLEDLSSGKEGWRWIKAEKTIYIKRWFYRVEQLSGKAFYGTDIILPAGKVMFEILTTNKYPQQLAPELEISLDGEIVGSTKIDERKRHVIFGHPKLGSHRLQLLLKPPEDLSQLKQKHTEIFIGRLRIKSLSDILLIYDKKNSTPHSSTKTYTASYLKEPIVATTANGRTSFNVSDPALQNLYTLYKLNYSRTSLMDDLGVGPNPHKLKKKMEIGENTINAIFAPTPSTYAFDVKIPEGGILQFGYGLLPSGRRTSSETGFQIMIEYEKKKETVFASSLQADEKLPTLRLDEKIDLQKYTGEKIKIRMITRNQSAGDKKEQPSIHHAYWHNPFIYQRRDKISHSTNVILVSLDTLRADHLGLFGYGKETSPNMDKLRYESAVFYQCYSTAPSTLRSHMSLLTGLDPISHQVYTQQDKLDPVILTLADILRVHGYTSTAFTGGARVSAVFGFAKGFDRYYENRSSWLEKDTPDELVEKSLNWLKNNRDKKHFLFLHTYQPHDPYANASEYGQLFVKKDHPWKKIELFQYLSQIESPLPFPFIPLDENQRENIVALYDGEIRYTDEKLIKPLIAGLKDMDLYDNTMLIITSDHGEEFYEHGMWMHGGQLYNELIRVPLIIKFPRSKHGGKGIPKNISLVDIVPTILKELGIAYAEHDFDGKDISHLLSSDKASDRFCFSEIPVKGNLGKISVVHKDFKLIFNRIVHEDRFEDQAPSDEWELYNLREDPGELKNLAAPGEERVKFLMTKIEEYLQKEPRAKTTGKEKPVIDEELMKRLKALGYIE